MLGLRHAAVPVSDLKRAVKFYCDVLGFAPYHTTDTDWAMVRHAGTTVSLVKTPSHAVLSPPPKPGHHPAHLGFLLDSV